MLANGECIINVKTDIDEYSCTRVCITLFQEIKTNLPVPLVCLLSVSLFLSLSLSGKNCELCISGFFRLEESDPTSLDVCQPCNCHAAGTVNAGMKCAQVHTTTNSNSVWMIWMFLNQSKTCFSFFSFLIPLVLCVSHLQVGGQCQCKVAVTGRRCADCLPGWHGLKASNPNGCTRCNCSDIGIISNSTGGVPSCNQVTGQCQCKPHVTGEQTNTGENQLFKVVMSDILVFVLYFDDISDGSAVVL